MSELVDVGLRVVFRPLLVQGVFATDAEGPILFIDCDQSEREQAVSVWHETLHLLLCASGYAKHEHDEEQIDAIAERLADACPEIVGLLRRT